MAGIQGGFARDTALTLVEAAILAPSSHNTQPWVFRITDEAILLFADRTRALPVNDPDDRELTISCGCALLNLRVAAARAGLDARVVPPATQADPDHLASVVIHAGDEAPADAFELFEALGARRTCRQRFERRAVAQPLIDELAAAARQEGMQWHTLSTEAARLHLAALVAEGDAAQWGNPSWRRELAAWMHPRRQGDGLVLPGLPAALARAVVRTFDMGKGVAARDRQIVEESPLIAVLTSSTDSPADWLACGQGLQRTLLLATARGLQASYLNQPVQIPPLRQNLRDALRTARHPQVVLRMGYPTAPVPQSPRRPLAAVLDTLG